MTGRVNKCLRLGMVAAFVSLVLAPAAMGQAPDPGGDETAILRGAPAGKEFGFNDSFGLEGLGPGLEADRTIQIGGNAARMPMSWWGLEGVRDVYNEVIFLEFKLAYDALLARGVEPHFSITHAPTWARDEQFRDCTDRAWCNYPPAEGMLDEWREFMAELARRFPQATLEVWNEPNFLGSWRSGVDPARYVRLLKAGYAAAKAVRPNMQVFMGGLGSSEKPQSLTAVEFMKQAYGTSPSLQGHTDALNLHIYPGKNLGAGSFLARVFDGVRTARAAAGDTTPIYVTETGSSTTGPNPVNQDEQADIIMRATRRMLTMPDVSGVLVSRLVEDHDYPDADPERGLGVMAPGLLGGLEPKLAFCSLTRAARALDALCPPDTRITVPPPALTSSSSVTVSFDSPDSATAFQCSVDGEAFLTCSSPHTFTGLADGEHSFQFRARDALLRNDPFPAQASARIDTTPPETTVEGPEGDTRDDSPWYFLSAGEPRSSFECSVDGSAFEACASPFRPGPLSEGAHVLGFRAVDEAGNPDPTPVGAALLIDKTAPDTSIANQPRRFESDATPSVSFGSSEPGGSVECATDSWDFQPCASPLELGPLSDGDHAFRVRALDRAGNVDATAAAVNFTVDTVAPTSSFLAGPSNVGRDSTPTFWFEPSEPVAGFVCRVDTAAFAPCASGITTQALADGSHTFEVKATDRAGNTGPAKRMAFEIDTRPPETTLGTEPRRLESNATPTVTFASSESGGSFECATDSWSFSACASPVELGPLSDGDHAFRVRALDRAGNVDSTAAAVNFIVDTDAPEVSYMSGPEGATANTKPSFNFTVDDPAASVECRFNQDAYGSCYAPKSHQPLVSLPEGAHTLEVRSTDPAGNAGVAVRRFAVDLTAPAAPAISSRAGWEESGWTGPEAWFDVAPPEPDTDILCRVDSAPFEPCSGRQRLAGLTGGVHLFQAKAVDGAGHFSDPSSWTFNVDLEPPETTISKAPRRVTLRSAQFTFASPDGIAFFCSFDREPRFACKNPHTEKGLKRGRHILEVVAVDGVGNVDPSPAIHRFRTVR